MFPDKQRLLDDMERDGRLLISPTALSLSPRGVRRILGSQEVAMQSLRAAMAIFPLPILQRVAEIPDMRVAVVHAGNVYHGRRQTVEIELRSLAAADGLAEHELTHLVDHALGSRAESVDSGRMSEGVGVTPRVAVMGQYLQELFQSEDFVDAYSRRNSREYLAQAVTCYRTDPSWLAAADPGLFRFVGEQFLNEEFWEEVFAHERT